MPVRTISEARALAVIANDVLMIRMLDRAVRRRNRRSITRWSKRAQTLNRRGRNHGVGGRVTGTQLRDLVESYGSLCAYCGCALDFRPRSARRAAQGTFDHVKPLSRGGRGDVGNLVPACAPCNSKRSTWPDSALGVPAPRHFNTSR